MQISLVDDLLTMIYIIGKMFVLQRNPRDVAKVLENIESADTFNSGLKLHFMTIYRTYFAKLSIIA